MTAKTGFNSQTVPPINPFIPQAVKAGGFIFMSGMPGLDPATGKLIGPGYEEQALQAFKNIKTILEEAGSGMDKVVKTTVFMVNGADADFSVINRIYNSFFPENPPVRSAPQVSPFPNGILISVECIALA